MGVIVAKLYALDSTELADISSIAFEKSMVCTLNGSRAYTIQAPAGHHLLSDVVSGDGYRNLRKGNRKLVVWEDDAVIFHGRIFDIERTGDGTQNLVSITAYDPLMELGFDSDDRAGRPVRDDKGNFITPKFVGNGTGGANVMSGPDLIQQVLNNSLGTDDEGGAHPGEGPLPIDLVDGTWELDVPPAIDLSVVDTMDWPVLCGDFIAQLAATGVVDIYLAPLDPAVATDPYFMVVMSAVSSLGTDKSGTVHFDYFTGDHNAAQCRHLESFSTINNKLYDYLGPRYEDLRHWAGNITPGSPGTTVDPSASRTLYGGQFMSIRIFDSVGGENMSRPLYLALWNGEQRFRVEPRDLLYVTPAPDAKALFQPPGDYDVGDLVAINTGDDFGVELAETQRIYGYTKTWDRQGVARVSELLTSADPS